MSALSLSRAMRWIFAAAALGLTSAAAPARLERPPLYDPVMLNIGFVCQWQTRCMAMQNGAMKRSLGYVRKRQPQTWRIELCNRNAARKRQRVDWIGFENCIRNPALRPLPSLARRDRNRR
jgi:hypothetical protein